MLNNLKNNIYTYTSFFGMMIGMVINLLLAYKLGIENYGIYTIVLLYSTLISVLIELGLGQEIVQHYKNKKLTKKGLRLLTSTISSAVLIFSLITLKYFGTLKQFYGILYFIPLSSYLYEYTERFIGHSLYSSVVLNLYKIIALIYLLIAEINIQTYLYFIIYLQLFISILIFVKNFSSRYLEEIRQLDLSINKNVWFSRIITTISQQVDKIILSSFLSIEWFSVYSFTNTLVLPIGSFIQFRTAENFKLFSKAKLKINLFKKYILPIITIYVGTMFMYVLLSNYFSDYKFKSVFLISSILVSGYVLQSLYQQRLSFLLYTNNTKTILRVNLITTVSTLTLMTLIVILSNNGTLWLGSFVISMLGYFISYKYVK